MKKTILTLGLMLTMILTAAPSAMAQASDSDTAQTRTGTVVSGEETQDQTKQTTTDSQEQNGNDRQSAESDHTAAKQPDSKIITKTVTKKIRRQVKVKAKPTGRGTIRVNWSKLNRSHGYKVYRSTRRNGSYRNVYTTGRASKTKWTDKSRTLKRNRHYYYKVKPRRLSSLVTTRRVTVKTTSNRAGAAVKSVSSVKSRNTAISTKAKVKNTIQAKKCMTMRATAYSGGGRCANGKRCAVGRIAVDPRVVRLGTWVYVDGYGLAQACDTGGAIKGKRIDLYFNGGESRCGGYGVRSVKLFILR